MASAGLPERLREAFEQRYIPEPNSGCWLWEGSCNRNGYGRVYMGPGPRPQAHHVSLLLVGIEVGGGLVVRHTCDVPCCVNPDHLRLGTQADNALDMAKRSRGTNRRSAHPRGVKPVGNRFRARVRIAGRETHLGYFDDPGSASRAVESHYDSVWTENLR